MKLDWSSIDSGRMERSRDVKLISIDHTLENAEFQGSKSARYVSTLESCSCTDFSRHPYRPCKHMIRLADELHKLDELCNRQLSIDFVSAESEQGEKRPGKKPNAYLALSDYVTIDLETTGKDIRTAGVLDFGAVRVVDHRVVDTFSMLANPGVPNEAEDVNHITAEMIESAPPVTEALRLFLDFVGDSPVVGYNISAFDTCLIYDLCVLCFDRPFTNDIVDAYLLSQKTNGARYKLSEICGLYGIVNDQAHRALSDALSTQKLYEILKRYIYLGEPRPAAFALGGYTDSMIYENILRITEDTSKNIELRRNKTGASVFMFGALAFSIKMNSRSQYIETTVAAAEKFVRSIPGASAVKSGYRFPIACSKDAAAVYNAMILAVYEQRRSAVSGERFGCCNDFIRCSDALECLYKDSAEYKGCYYRQNLEAGRVFYGKNKNV